MERLSHELRQKRRKQLVADAKQLLDEMTLKQVSSHLAERYGLHYQYVKTILGDSISKADIIDQTNKLILRKARLIVELPRASGYVSTQEIVSQLSSQLQVSNKRVRDVLKSSNFKMPKMPKEPTLNQQLLIDYLNKGYDLSSAAKLMGCTRQYTSLLYNQIIEHPQLCGLVPDKQQLHDNKKLQVSILKADKRSKIIESLESNPEFTVEQHAAVSGCTTKQVQIIINNSLFTRAKISFREQQPRRFKYLQVIADLMNTDLTMTELAKKYGKPVPAIFNMAADCRAVGIPIKERRDGRLKRRLTDQEKSQMTLGNLINRVSKLDMSMEMDGICCPHGYNSGLAFSRFIHKMRVSDVISDLNTCVGKTLIDSNGVYVDIGLDTTVWITQCGHEGERILSIEDNGTIITAK